MLSDEMKRYGYHRLWDMDLDSAAHVLKLLKQTDVDAYRYPLLRDLVVTYCRPFVQTRKAPSLPENVAPKQYRDLHRQLLLLRNKQFAHSDHDLHMLKFGWLNLRGGARLAMTFKTTDQLGVLARLDDVEALILAVQADLKERTRNIQYRLEMSGEIPPPAWGE